MANKESIDDTTTIIDKAFDAWNSKFMVPMLEFYLLAVIKKGIRYGGQLVEMARKDLNNNIKIPTVYAMLKKAIEINLLTDMISEKEISDELTTGAKKSRGVKRRYYSITLDGIKYLNILKNQIIDVNIIINNLEMNL